MRLYYVNCISDSEAECVCVCVYMQCDCAEPTASGLMAANVKRAETHTNTDVHTQPLSKI